MTAYLWTMIVLGWIGLLCRLAMLATGKTTSVEITPLHRAISMVVNGAFLAWASYLLFVVGVS